MSQKDSEGEWFKKEGDLYFGLKVDDDDEIDLKDSWYMCIEDDTKALTIGYYTEGGLNESKPMLNVSKRGKFKTAGLPE